MTTRDEVQAVRNMEVGTSNRSHKRSARQHVINQLMCPGYCSIQGNGARAVQTCDYGEFLCLCGRHTMVAQQPPIMGAFLSAKEANQQVDLNTLPADPWWKHVAVSDVICPDYVYDSALGDLAASDLTDAKGVQWHDFGALADVSLATSATASQVPTSFNLQDQFLLSAWVCKDIRGDQAATVRNLPGLEKLVHDTYRHAQDELIAHVMEDGARWAVV